MAVTVVAGVVDVFVVHPAARGWRVLVLQRADDTRCPGAWETVHGRILDRETPQDAAVRELREETGLTADRLYNVTTHGFYLHESATVQIAVAFCAFVSRARRVTLGDEHSRSAWLSRTAAARRFAWPSERDCLARAWALLRHGNAGRVEDVLRVR
jgi:dATP pyrophosphohydrolase